MELLPEFETVLQKRFVSLHIALMPYQKFCDCRYYT